MIFDRNEQKAVVALLGAGSMGTAIVRRIGAGKKILLGDISEKALERVGDDFPPLWLRCGDHPGERLEEGKRGGIRTEGC